MTEGRPPLPEVIDLSAEATPVEDDPIDHAVAAFGSPRTTRSRSGCCCSRRTAPTAPWTSPTSVRTRSISCCRAPAMSATRCSRPPGSTSCSRRSTALMVYDLPRRRVAHGSTRAAPSTTWQRDLGQRSEHLRTRGTPADPDRSSTSSPVSDGAVASSTPVPTTLWTSRARPVLPVRTGPHRPDGVLQSWGSGRPCRCRRRTGKRRSSSGATGDPTMPSSASPAAPAATTAGCSAARSSAGRTTTSRCTSPGPAPRGSSRGRSAPHRFETGLHDHRLHAR